MTNLQEVIRLAHETLAGDKGTLDKIDRYLLGNHDLPYMPPTAEREYLELAIRAQTNWMQSLINAPAQLLYVDGFRRSGVPASNPDEKTAEMRAWQDSRMDAHQASIYRSALSYGHCFTVTEKRPDGKIITRGLSPRTTIALYEDPAFDMDPVVAVSFRSKPTDKKPGLIWAWDEEFFYQVHYKTMGEFSLAKPAVKHGNSSCPVTRFSPHTDLEGRTQGLVLPMIPLQDRINQTVFDLLVAQTYTSFNVRTVTGMAPPMKMVEREDGTITPLLDSTGNPVPDRQYLAAHRWFYAEDSDVKFDQLPGGQLDGFIQSAELAVRHMSALSQVPPHYLMGQIANVSAEALAAAETSLARRAEEFRHTFGESWERTFRLAAELAGESGAAEDSFGEVVWRDMGISSLSRTADALGKMAQSLSIPPRGLWTRIPGVSPGELAEWQELYDEDRELRRTEMAMVNGPMDDEEAEWQNPPTNFSNSTPPTS